MTKPLVIYHASCTDGFTAAWVARRHFMLRLGVEPELLPAHYGDAPPTVTDRDVLIVDFSYPRDALIVMRDQARSLHVYDHHRTAQADLDGLPFCTFDMERSGAGLAWDALFAPEPRPWLVDYVEDRDLWRWALPCSREINADLAARDFSIEAWDLLAASQPDACPGTAILRYRARELAKHVARARPAALRVSADLAHVVPVVNATTLISEIGNELAKDAPFAAMWFESDGAFVYSLRSSADNPEAVDVSEIAQRFGGGGHRHAAGFRVPAIVHEVRL